MNEGVLGKMKIGGERAATDDHPVILHALPLADTVKSELEAGTLLKKIDVTETTGEGESAVTTVVDVAYVPFLSTDTTSPCAVVDKPCDPATEKSAVSVVHGTVKARILKTGANMVPSGAQLAKLAERGVFAI